MKLLLVLSVLSFITTNAMAEAWPNLDQYVKNCDLIILCETEMVDDKPIFKVLEEWKGEYKPTDFNQHLQARIPKPGYLPAGLVLHSGRKSHSGQKVVFFFTHSKEKYSGSSTSFDVRQGKLTYAETGWLKAKEYTLVDFKIAITEAIETQRKSEQIKGESTP